MASVLETFLFKFSSNADELEKGFDDASQSANELADEVEDTGKQADKANKSFFSLTKAVVAAGASYAALKAVQSTLEITKQVDQLGKLTDMLGFNTSEVDAWGGALEIVGGNAADFVNTLDGLNSQLQETALTGQSGLLPVFNLLGISALDAGGKARDSFEVLGELADSFEGLSQQDAVSLGRKIGLDDATIRLLMLGRREIEELTKRQKELGTITEEDKERAAEFQDALAEMGRAFSSLSRKLTMDSVPAFTKFANLITDLFVWLRENRTIVTGFFIGLSTVITTAYLPAILAAAKATLAAMAPFILIVAAIAAVSAAIALVYDDLMNWAEGNDSIVGGLLGDFESFKASVLNIFEELRMFIDNFFSYWEDKANKVAELKEKVFGDESAIGRAREGISRAGESAFNAVSNSAVGRFFGGGDTQQNASLKVDTIQVNTQATDADGIARDVNKSLFDSFKSTINFFDDGVKG